MTEYIAEALAKNMFTDGLIKEDEKSIYYMMREVML